MFTAPHFQMKVLSNSENQIIDEVRKTKLTEVKIKKKNDIPDMMESTEAIQNLTPKEILKLTQLKNPQSVTFKQGQDGRIVCIYHIHKTKLS